MSLIKTPSGVSPYSGIRRSNYSSYYKCVFTNGKTLECSPNHPFMTYDGIVLAKNLSTKSEIYSESGGVFLKHKRLINKEVWLYDALNTNKNVYYTNGILSHNCSFLGSSNTLVSSTKLSTLAWKPPLKKLQNLHIYEDPKSNHMYVISVDTSEGQGLDYSAFAVIDVTEAPYKLVAKYYDNKITPMLYPNVIMNVGAQYNMAHILAETNAIGMQVVDILHNDLEYENIFSTSNLGRGGQRISSGFKKNSKLGVKMTAQIKSIGCSNLKSLLENNKMVIEDFDTISELTSFVATGSSFAAEPGCNDDLTMCLVLFSWLTAQPSFKELTDLDIRRRLYDEKVESMNEQLLPFGFIQDGSGDKTFKDTDGTVWEHVDRPSGQFDSDGFFWDDVSGDFDEEF